MAKFDPKKADQPKLIDKVLAKLPHLKLFLQNTVTSILLRSCSHSTREFKLYFRESGILDKKRELFVQST